ncbi:MAG TPA: cupredoxin domain-containing protein [Dehalococcoidia bacterium]|nr:cupredoxin domain-containing protein [Dehalococcoidia bacterium]
MSRPVHAMRGVAFCSFMALLLLIAACSSNNNKNNAVSTVSPGGGANAPVNATTVAAPSTPAAAHSAVPAQASPVAGAQALTETATDNKYSETQFTVKANQPVALTLKNEGQAVHNWHLLDATDAGGKEIKGALLDPGKSETLDFTIAKPGTYHFQCDVHPTEMKGTLVVQ